MVQDDRPVGLDGVRVRFDDERVVCDAGVMLVATLAERLGVEALARRWLLSVPGRLTRHARGWTLHLPARWPWHGDYARALDRIRALPAAT